MDSSELPATGIEAAEKRVWWLSAQHRWLDYPQGTALSAWHSLWPQIVVEQVPKGWRSYTGSRAPTLCSSEKWKSNKENEVSNTLKSPHKDNQNTPKWPFICLLWNARLACIKALDLTPLNCIYVKRCKKYRWEITAGLVWYDKQ